jgi:hypothetical protein
MPFNHFAWNNYKQTNRYTEICNLFSSGSINTFNLEREIFDAYFNNFKEILSDGPAISSIDDAFGFYLNSVMEFEDITLSDEYEEKFGAEIGSEEGIEWTQQKWLEERKKENKNERLYIRINGNIAEISSALFKSEPEYFLPYFYNPFIKLDFLQKEKFDLSFDLFQKICNEFDINLLETPAKTELIDRASYYMEICCDLYDFRIEHKLTPIEMCAFLYDFAPKFCEETRDKDLPSPLRVWLIKGAHGGEQDFNWLEQNTGSNTRTYWNGNIRTKRGDILLMYCVSPYSYIHSIWRANCDGFVNPFFYFHNQIEITNGIKVPTISFLELQKTELISVKPEMKAKLQTNTGGIEFSNSEYCELQNLLQKKGFDTSCLEQLPFSDIALEMNINDELDVEDKLLEPLLKELGFTERDWIRQHSIRIGTRERIIPDYIFGLKVNKENEIAKMIIEAKFRYQKATLKEQEMHFKQARSYALNLQSSKLLIADKDGFVWFYKVNNDFDKNNVEVFSWPALKSPETFQKLKILVNE